MQMYLEKNQTTYSIENVFFPQRKYKRLQWHNEKTHDFSSWKSIILNNTKSGLYFCYWYNHQEHIFSIWEGKTYLTDHFSKNYHKLLKRDLDFHKETGVDLFALTVWERKKKKKSFIHCFHQPWKQFPQLPVFGVTMNTGSIM